MTSSDIITAMIVICLIFMGFVIFSKPIKSLLRFILQAIGGLCAAVILNIILSPFSLAVGINYLTAFIIGLLGIPGFVSLYIIQLFL